MIMVDTAISKSKMVLYADNGYDSHVVQVLLEEKQQVYHLAKLDHERPEDLRELNPYNTLPVLTHQDLTLYEINVIFEYLEERYRGHQLLPEAPSQRAQYRQLAWRIQNDWLKLARTLLTHPDSFDQTAAARAKKDLSDALITLSPLFSRYPYFMSDTYGWCDVLLSVMLYRLENMQLRLPAALCQPLLTYKQHMLSRDAFLNTL